MSPALLTRQGCKAALNRVIEGFSAASPRARMVLGLFAEWLQALLDAGRLPDAVDAGRQRGRG